MCPALSLCSWVLFPWGGGRDSAPFSDHDPGILDPLPHREPGAGTVCLLVGTSFFLPLTVFLFSSLSLSLSLLFFLPLLSLGLFLFPSILFPTSPFTSWLLILCLSHLPGGGIKAFLPSAPSSDLSYQPLPSVCQKWGPYGEGSGTPPQLRAWAAGPPSLPCPRPLHTYSSHLGWLGHDSYHEKKCPILSSGQ